MDAYDLRGLIAACLQYGDAKAGGEPGLWADALTFLCSLPAGDDAAGAAGAAAAAAAGTPAAAASTSSSRAPAAAAGAVAAGTGADAAPQLPDGAAVTAAIVEVLGYIEAGNLLPPLVVLHALSQNLGLKVRCCMPGRRRGWCELMPACSKKP